MKKPKIPFNEPERQALLDELNIVYTPAEERFDRITRLAKRLFDVPIVIITMVNNEIQWFKSCQGLTVSETGRDISFCGHAILKNEPFIVTDTLENPFFQDNPLVTGSPHIRFYAGQPINFFNQNLGTLCIIDTRPRQMSQDDIDSLRSLAAWIEAEILTWRNSKNTFLEQVMKVTDRKALLDPVTGDLNPDGMDLVLSSLYHDTHEDNRPPCIQIEITDLDAHDMSMHPDSLSTVKQAIAGAIRTVLDDRGLLGMNTSKTYLTILNEKDDKATRKIFREIEEKLANLEIDLNDSTYTPTVLVSLVTFEQEKTGES